MPVTMCATLDAPHAAETDLVFCVPLALAWKSLTQRFGPLRFDPQPALADALNALDVPAEAVDPSWCVAAAGFGAEGIVEAIRRELLARIPDATPELLPTSIAPEALLAYGYLDRKLRFPTVFGVRDGSFRGRRVRAFGIVDDPFKRERDRARAAQVVVHDWASPREFLIELCADDPEDRILVAQIPPREALGATVRDALDRLGRMHADYRALRDGEEVSVPRLELAEAASFDALTGRPLANEALRGRSFDEAKQRMRFTLDEGGASAAAEATLMGFGPPPPKRSFCLSEPFLVMLLRRASSLPYLALWVETPGWMQVLGSIEPAPNPAGFTPGGPWGWGPPSG